MTTLPNILSLPSSKTENNQNDHEKKPSQNIIVSCIRKKWQLYLLATVFGIQLIGLLTVIVDKLDTNSINKILAEILNNNITFS